MSTTHAPPASAAVAGAVSLTVDVVALTIRGGELCALVIQRGEPPYAGAWALPGEPVRDGEDLEEAARRALVQETGVGVDDLEQLATYAAPGRDPRGRTVTVAHLAVIPWAPEAQAGADATDAEWCPVTELEADPGETGALAFDHARILADGIERTRSKLEYTNLATRFVPDDFTISELRAVYDVIWGSALDPGNFHRKVVGTDGFVVETGARREGGSGRPARMFRAGAATALHPALTRRSVRSGAS